MAKRALRKPADDVEIVGADSHPLRDIYYRMLTMPWWAMLLSLGAFYLFLNAIFGAVYMFTGGIEGGDGSFADAFFFSAQTLGTIGYGAMHPTRFSTNVVVTLESLVSVLFVALSTGLVFTRFSRSTESVVFCDFACIGLMDGQPTLTIRIGNDREGAIMDAQVNITMFRTHHTAEGVTMYRMKELVLARNRTSALGRTFTIIHVIDEDSPLHGLTPEGWEKDEVELLVNVVGTDDTLLQPVYGRGRYQAHEVKWGARLGDVLEELPNGKLQLDVRKFDDVVWCEPTDAFPYPRA
ncbi:MAG: ion channel [Labilithrix sp.]